MMYRSHSSLVILDPEYRGCMNVTVKKQQAQDARSRWVAGYGSQKKARVQITLCQCDMVLKRRGEPNQDLIKRGSAESPERGARHSAMAWPQQRCISMSGHANAARIHCYNQPNLAPGQCEQICFQCKQPVLQKPYFIVIRRCTKQRSVSQHALPTSSYIF